MRERENRSERRKTPEGGVPVPGHRPAFPPRFARGRGHVRLRTPYAERYARERTSVPLRVSQSRGPIATALGRSSGLGLLTDHLPIWLVASWTVAIMSVNGPLGTNPSRRRDRGGIGGGLPPHLSSLFHPNHHMWPGHPMLNSELDTECWELLQVLPVQATEVGPIALRSWRKVRELASE